MVMTGKIQDYQHVLLFIRLLLCEANPAPALGDNLATIALEFNLALIYQEL